MSSAVMNCLNSLAPQIIRLPSRRLTDAALLSLMVLDAEVSAWFRKLLIVQPDSLPLQVFRVTACDSPQTRVQPNNGSQLMNNKTPGASYCPTRTGYYSNLMTFSPQFQQNLKRCERRAVTTMKFLIIATVWQLVAFVPAMRYMGND